MTCARVVLLTSDGESGRIAASSLAAAFPDLTVIVESPISQLVLLKRRLRRLGAIRVAGQLAFMAFQLLQRWRARKRIAELGRIYQLKTEWPRLHATLRVDSVNSPECIAHLRAYDPHVVLVVGTRLIDSAVLAGIGVPFINYHSGITPKYRGVHGGYWAIAEADPDNFGVTVHLVDAGIDTGGVLYQARLIPTTHDNFSTYPYLQIAAALPLLERAARDAIAGMLKTQRVDLPSRLWSHPTLWFYLATGFRGGAW
jgi:folate-dependent phosphoribosylglycinamide formyltransferase PurN